MGRLNASELGLMTITVVEDCKLSDVLKNNESLRASNVWTTLTYINAFEAEDEASKLVADFLRAYDEANHSDFERDYKIVCDQKFLSGAIAA